MGCTYMNIEHLKEFSLNLMNKSYFPQKEILMESLYARANETHYHHNMMLQIQNLILTEKEIYKMRDVLKSLQARLWKKGLIIDFILIDIPKSAYQKLHAIGINGKSYDTNIKAKDTLLSTMVELIKKLKQKSFRFKEFGFYGSIEDYMNEVWNITLPKDYQKRGNILKEKYDYFYSQKTRERAIIEKNKRKREIYHRINYINSLDYPNLIFKKEGDKYSNDEWCKFRIASIKEINLPEKLMKRYIKYGLKTPIFDIHFIDLYIYADEELKDDYKLCYCLLITSNQKFTPSSHFYPVTKIDEARFHKKDHTLSEFNVLYSVVFEKKGISVSELKKHYSEKWGWEN